MHNNAQAIILAAGSSTRFNTSHTKLIEKICGQEIIAYPLRTLKSLGIPTCVVVGYQKELITHTIEQYFDAISFFEQNEPLGTGDAVKTTRSAWNKEYILLMKADVPLITQEMLTQLFDTHIQTKATITFMAAHNESPTGFSYGRVVSIDGKKYIKRPFELSSDEINEHSFVNGGIMIINRSFLEKTIDTIPLKPESNEYHMSDLVNCASEQNHVVSMLKVPFDHIRSINNFQELWAAEQIKRAELARYWMDQGVRFTTPQTIHIDLPVRIGAGSFVGCGVHLLGTTTIGKQCTISPSAMIIDSVLEDNVVVHPHTIIKNSTIKQNAQVGPFAHILEGTTIGPDSQIGNFVEVKRTTIGTATKAKHLTYLGDAQIGSEVNIGAGTITCNFDGKHKKETIIKDYVFIGTNNSLVAPLTIHEKSYTAAGSVITEDVPENALAIGRSKQINKENYACKVRSKQSNFSFMGAVKTSNETTSEM